MTSIRIGSRPVGPDEPPYVVAEAGVNHNGDLSMARDLVEAAAQAGADAVKFQSYDTDRLVSRGAPIPGYQETEEGTDSQAELLGDLEIGPADLAELKDTAVDHGIDFLCTPFDARSVERLDELGVPAIKVGSGEVTNTPLLRKVAETGRPVILSTGMSYLGEVDRAVRTLEAAGNDDYILLHCVSDYPADPRDANLEAINTLAAAYGCPVGFSDHTQGVDVPLAAVARGAQMIEKHLTLDTSLPGPDHEASMEPDDLADLNDRLHTVHEALGTGRKEPTPAEAGNRTTIRRSLAARRDLPAGTTLEDEHLVPLRPATGIPPWRLEDVLGRRTRKDVESRQILSWEDLE